MLTGEVTTYETDNCRVEVYQSRSLAVEAGMTEEICRVHATTAFSLDHSRAVAMERGVKKVCDCGASKAYVVSLVRGDVGLEGTSKADLVGFR
jgi:hypothetical protein